MLAKEIQMKAVVIAAIAGVCCSLMQAQAVSPLFARGYTVIPEPQKVSLAGSDLAIQPRLAVETG